MLQECRALAAATQNCGVGERHLVVHVYSFHAFSLGPPFSRVSPFSVIPACKLYNLANSNKALPGRVDLQTAQKVVVIHDHMNARIKQQTNLCVLVCVYKQAHLLGYLLCRAYSTVAPTPAAGSVPDPPKGMPWGTQACGGTHAKRTVAWP